MASLARLHHRHRLLLSGHRYLSSASLILNPSDPSAPLTAHQKSRAALSLLRSEKNPARVADICTAAALTPSSHLDRLSLSLAVSSLSTAGSFSAVRSLLSDLLLSPHPDLRSDPRLRPHAIVLFGQAGMLDDAISTFKSSPDSPPTVRSLNALLFACILAKKHDEVGRIFRDFPTTYGVTPDLDTYNTVIKAFCESGSSRSFYSVLDEMGRMRIKPSLTTFSTALSGFYREERFDDIEKVIKLMKKHDCRPGLSVYNVRIQSLCKLKKPGEAKELFKEMRTKGMKPNWVTYNHLIFGFCSIGDLEEAKMLYKEMGKRGLVPESNCYFTLIHYLSKGGHFESALEVCQKSLEKNWIPAFSTMKLLVSGLVDSSKVEEARGLIEKVKEKFPGNAERWKEVEDGLPQ